MFCISGRAALAIGALVTVSSCAKHYRAEGVVLKIDPPHQTVTISHRAIPGYMEAMAMAFAVREPRDLNGLVPGARVTFHLNVRRKRAQVSHIRRESTGIDDVPVQAEQHKILAGEPVPDFSLTDQRNQTVKLSDFRGRPVVLDFIYTRCPLPDVCPRLSANMARLQKRFSGRVSLLSITIDPQFDTPEVLAEYAHRWRADPKDWLFLTGPPDRIGAVAGNFGLVYWAEEGLITHTAATAVIDAQGRLKALLEGSSFTSQQLLDLVSASAGLASQPAAPGPATLPAR
ncbi:MAG: SCO family protein [Bryobacteraceae bacterium]